MVEKTGLEKYMMSLRTSLLLSCSCDEQFFPSESELRTPERFREREAAEELRNNYFQSRQYVETNDYLGAMRRLSKINELLDFDFTADDLSEEFAYNDDLEICTQYSWAYERMNDSFYSLAALRFFLRHRDRYAVLRCLRDADWATKNEILTRWGWMHCQKELINRGYNLIRPFRGEVAKRGEAGRNLDREFYSLILFLRGLRIVTGEELLFESKSETPDFVLRIANDSLAGAEMTEAPQSNLWSREMDAMSRVRSVVQESVVRYGCSFEITKPDSWFRLSGQIDAIAAWLETELQGSTEPRALCHPELGIKLRLRRGGNGSYLIVGGDGLTGEHIRELEGEFLQSLLDRIHAKIRKKSRSGTVRIRKKPEVRPCHLVIYANNESIIKDSEDAENIASALRSSLCSDVKTYFDKVWIVKENLFLNVY